MEVAPCIQEISGHTASLLTCLNLQRQQALFCDCVIRQRQSPAQLYPAHRCVLAASSPVLASILSSTGALVELQAPCLSDPVLALLLEYIYTGALPRTPSQQQYCSLLTAARYLQMDKLQTLCAWNQTEVNIADKTNASTGTENQPLTQEHSGSVDTCFNEPEADMCGPIIINGANCTLSNVSSCFNTSESSGNRANCGHATHLTLQNSITNNPSTTEGYSVSRGDKDIQKDQFHSAGTVKPVPWQKSTEAELVKTAEGKRGSTFSSSSLPRCGAVPVICHSSTAASAMPAYHSVCQTSIKSSRPPASRSASTENEGTVDNITSESKNNYRVANLDYRNDSDHTGAQGWDCKDRSAQYATQDQTDMVTQEYTCSSTDHVLKLDERGLSLTTDTTDNNHHAHCDSFQSENHTNHVRDDSVSQSKLCSSLIRDLKYKRVLSFDDSHSKHQRLDWSDSHDVSASAATEERSQDLRVPHSEGDSDTGSDSYSEDFRHSRQCSLYAAKTESSLGMVTGEHSAFEPCTSLDLEAISDPETPEPHFRDTAPVDSNMSDSMYNAVGQSYHGHVHYHCLPQEDMHLSHEDSDHKHSYPTYPHHSDQSSDEEGGTFTSSGCSPLAMGSTEQVLLLDISTKHSELLVSYKHRDDQEKKGVVFRTEIRNDNRNEAASVARVDAATIGASEQSRSGTEVKNKDGVMKALSKHEEGENQTSTLTVCSAPRVSDTASRASVSSMLSVCIPSTLPASMSTNISAHLSTPVHHAFQCTLCDRSFSQRGSLNRHVRSHLGVRPFPCPRCPMTFSRQYRVTEHMRVHQRCSLESNFPKPPASSI